MKITKSQLKQLINEEVKRFQLNEYFYHPMSVHQDAIKEIIKELKGNEHLDDELIKSLFSETVDSILNDLSEEPSGQGEQF